MKADLDDLDAFAAVARMRSFRKAAAARQTSPSGLSEAVRRLETRLGTRLLNRTTRSVTPTEAGAALLERLMPALTEIASAVDRLGEAKGRVSGTLRLNVPTVIARLILPPIAARFLAAYPDVRMEVMAEDGFVDVLGAGFDAGVRYEESLAKDMVAVPLGPRVQRYVTAASPAYLKAHGEPKHPRDLLKHDCILHRFASGNALAWEFERAGKPLKIAPPGRLIGSALELEIAAAIDGVGLIHTFGDALEPALKSGKLVRVLAAWSPSFSGPYLYYAGGRLLPAPLRAFVDFVKRGTPRVAVAG